VAPPAHVNRPRGDPARCIERLLEPRSTADAAAVDPEEYERLRREPGFLAIRAVPDPRR
jgi:hypothetical protein